MVFRKATIEDLGSIVDMLADDVLGQTRENNQIPLPLQYVKAFEKIIVDPNQELIVAENDDHAIVGTLQITFIQYLTYKGGIRAQVEAVRVRKDFRDRGIGRELINWVIRRAKERKAHVIQLTTDKKRPDALEFYKEIGFQASHEGMKLHLNI